MNRSVLFVLTFIFIMIVMISSCSNKLNEPGFPGLRCDINGTEFIADTAYYVYNYHLGSTIYAYKGGVKIFQFNLETSDTTGTYNLDTSGVGNSALYFDGPTIYQSISGSVNITQFYNDSLGVCNGNFSFTGRVPGSSGNTVSIQYGYFNTIPRHY